MSNTQDKIESLVIASTEVIEKEPSYNILIINTPRGKMTIKTHLTADEWIAEQNLKLKPKKITKRKRK